ncbi:MAG: family 16 glycoside hydrolase [Terracidiphilus sp.]
MQNPTVNPYEHFSDLRCKGSTPKFALRLSLGLFMLMASCLAQAAEQVKIPMTADRWTTTAGTVNFVEFKGKPSIELKAGNYAQHVPSGAVALNDLTFRNGTIEYDVAATSDMGASFVFRRADKDNYEMFYLRPRPNCDAAPDCVQYAPQTHGVLLWDLFPQYQGPAPLRMGEWNHVKLVVSGKRMNVFINGSTAPTLKIGRLEGDTGEGSLMLQGPGIFANLVVTPDEVEGLTSDPEGDATASDERYVRHWQISPFSKLDNDQSPTLADMPASSASWVPLEAERGGLVNASRVYGLPLPRPDRAVVWLKTTIRSDSAQQKHVSLGWAREIVVFVNGQLVFADKNLFQPPVARKTPDGRLSLENGSLMLPFKAGDNELAVAIVDNFYGWGLEMRFDDVKGLLLAPH